MLKKVLAVGGASAALLFGGYVAGNTGNTGAPRSAAPPATVLDANDPKQAVQNEVIVVFKDTADAGDQAAVVAAVDAAGTTDLDGGSVTASATALVELPNDVPASDAIVELSADPRVESVEPNWIRKTVAVSNDPQFTAGNMWGMYGDTTVPANAYGSQAAEVWAGTSTGSATVYVGDIDTGIDISHPDLAANIWTNPGEIAANATDDDGNGYIDDVNGWDFDNNDNSVYDDPIIDAHGTHTAGTIGAKGGNGIGVAGVNWDVTIIPAKVCGAGGCTNAAVIAAINYLTDLKVNHGLNIVATNNSYGGGGFSAAERNAIIAAGNADILHVAAAGNAGTDNDATPHYPSSYTCPAVSLASGAYDCIVAVAAIDSNGNLAGFSQYGLTTVDLGAPGVGVVSTTPVNTYSSYNGTSMATPHVTGASALVSAVHPTWSATQIKSFILSNVAVTADLIGTTVTGGRLDLSTLASLPVPPPAEALTVCHATETTGTVGPNTPNLGLFITYSQLSIGRGTAEEAVHAGHAHDVVWLSSASANACPTPGNGLGTGGFVGFLPKP